VIAGLVFGRVVVGVGQLRLRIPGPVQIVTALEPQALALVAARVAGNTLVVGVAEFETGAELDARGNAVEVAQPNSVIGR